MATDEWKISKRQAAELVEYLSARSPKPVKNERVVRTWVLQTLLHAMEVQETNEEEQHKRAQLLDVVSEQKEQIAALRRELRKYKEPEMEIVQLMAKYDNIRRVYESARSAAGLLPLDGISLAEWIARLRAKVGE